MMKIKAKDSLVFTLIAIKDGSYCHSYKDMKKYAKRFKSKPAGHIMHWLNKRGIVIHTLP